MIAAVKGWHAVPAALLFFSAIAEAADDPGGAAKELARKTAAFAGRGAAVAVTWRNRSSLESANQARAAFEEALQEAGLRTGDSSPLVEAKVTVSEDASDYLLVEEASKGDDHRVWIAAWKRVQASTTPAGGLMLEKKLIWEQEEQILDIAFPPAGMLVLSPSGITLYARSGAQWQAQRTVSLAPPKPWPADMRGHLRLRGGGFQALLPGMECGGTTEPSLSAECRPSEEAWVLESGSRALLLANFAPTRNYFDGRVTTQSGQHKNITPFFSAASLESQGRTWWVLAATDGRIQVFDAALEAAGVSSAQWGSDIAGTDAHCGAGSQVLATRPGDRGQPDSIQAFTMADRTPQPLTDPADFPGPVMALWTTGGSAATVIVKDLRSQQYSAYMLTVLCGN